MASVLLDDFWIGNVLEDVEAGVRPAPEHVALGVHALAAVDMESHSMLHGSGSAHPEAVAVHDTSWNINVNPGELSLRLVVQRDSVLAAAPYGHRHELHRLGKKAVRTISSSGALLRRRGALFSCVGFRSRVLVGLLFLVGGASCHPIAVGGRQATLAVRGGADLGARGTLVSHPAGVHIRRRAVLGRVVAFAHAQPFERVFEPA
eukprot:7391848-Prymnesium_polylepis.2